MIQLGKTATVLSVVVCGALLMSVRAQDREGARSRSATRPAQKRPGPVQGAMPAPPPAPASDVKPSPGFSGPPGLSEEAIKSFRELPPGSTGEEECPAEEQAASPPDSPPEGRNPFEILPGPAAASTEPPPTRTAPRLPSRSTPAKVQQRPEAKAQQRPEYVVEPPDLLLVEVLEALPGRPISGERLVRPDGRISLGFYGELPVAGLTLPQIKEKIVLHLRRLLNDDLLGLVDFDPETGKMKRDGYGRVILKDPRDTDRVFVDVTAYNSQHCYVLGEVAYPGMLPYTGGDTVLDLLQYAGGPLPTTEKRAIRLVRSFPKGSPARVLPVNYEEIAMGTDSSTNYAILPGDRLVVPRQASGRPEVGADRDAPAEEAPRRDAGAARTSTSRVGANLRGNVYYDRDGYEAAHRNATAALEQRIDELERKLDRLIELVGKNPPEPGGRTRIGGRAPNRGEPRRAGAMEPPSIPGVAEPDSPQDVPETGIQEVPPLRPREPRPEEPPLNPRPRY